MNMNANANQPKWANNGSSNQVTVLEAIEQITDADHRATLLNIEERTGLSTGDISRILSILRDQGKIESKYSAALREDHYLIVRQKTVTIPGNYSDDRQKVIIVRKNSTRDFDLQSYLQILSQYIAPGTNRHYFPYGNTMITMFMTEKPVEDLITSLTNIEIEFQVVHNEDDAVRAYVAYQDNSGYDILKGNITQYFDQFKPKLKLHDVLTNVAEGKTDLSELEWDLLRAHAYQLTGAGEIGPRRDGQTFADRD